MLHFGISWFSTLTAEFTELKKDYASLLRQCHCPSQGKALHEQIVKAGLGNDVFLGNLLVQMYGKVGSLEEARATFNKMGRRNQHTWTSMVTAFAQNGYANDALAFFQTMVREGVDPVGPTIVIVLGLCTDLQALPIGRWIHSAIVKTQAQTEVRIGTALINMYGKCGSPSEARIVFDKLQDRNVISWTSIVSVYTQNGEFQEALTLYHLMDLEGMQPDGVTLSKVLAACSGLKNLVEGKAVHDRIVKAGILLDEVLETALMSMYGKCGSFVEARGVFNKLMSRSRVPWNAMIAAYAQGGLHQDALQLFRQMEHQGVKPDAVTFISLAEASSSSVEAANSVGARACWYGLQTDVVLATALVNMYGKCGGLEEAKLWFDRLASKNAVTWTTMITIYAESGHPQLALELYKQMDVKPMASTYLAAFDACLSLDDLETAEAIHADMDSSGLPDVDRDLSSPLVTMYSKCGSLEKARRVFERSSRKNMVTWTAMVAAYSEHGHGDQALTLFRIMELYGMIPSAVSFTTILSACSHSGLLDEGLCYFISMTQNYFIPPTEKHFACMVDLLGRAGWMDMAELVANSPACRDDAVSWTVLLYACRLQLDNARADRIADRLLHIDADNLGHYEQLARLQSLASNEKKLQQEKILDSQKLQK